jgi:thiamine biosynthesis lipoprotein
LPESLISQVNARAGGGWTEIDREFDGLLDLCDEMHRLTGGIFDPASLPSLALWSWNTPRDELPSAQAIDAARTLWDWKTVQRCPGAVCLPEHGMGMDLGGIGKEFAVDQVMEIARQHDIHNILVDIGQDVRAQGRGPGKDAWYVGLEEPVDPDGPPPTRGCWACLRITGVAVASSGDYHRCFTRNGRRYGHILDPRTGEPVHNGCQSVNVIAPTCMLAGILSTTALILGPECGLELLRRHSSPSGVEGCITTPTARCQTRRFSDHVPF